VSSCNFDADNLDVVMMGHAWQANELTGQLQQQA
jgi:hypothetical protein